MEGKGKQQAGRAVLSAAVKGGGLCSPDVNTGEADHGCLSETK